MTQMHHIVLFLSLYEEFELLSYFVKMNNLLPELELSAFIGVSLYARG